MYLVGLGKIKAPEGMEEGWTDPYPLPLRILALVKWVLLVLFQVSLKENLNACRPSEHPPVRGQNVFQNV